VLPYEPSLADQLALQRSAIVVAAAVVAATTAAAIAAAAAVVLLLLLLPMQSKHDHCSCCSKHRA
jgi:hypothetical protein